MVAISDAYSYVRCVRCDCWDSFELVRTGSNRFAPFRKKLTLEVNWTVAAVAAVAATATAIHAASHLILTFTLKY